MGLFSLRFSSRFLRGALLCGALHGLSSSLLAFSTVVIDPGHGGADRGGIPGQRIAEKTMALDVGKRLAGILEPLGIGVRMTRQDDTFIPLETRSDISNETFNAVFVSIHFDAFRGSHAEGITVIYYTSKSRSLAETVHRQMVRHLHPSVDRGVTVRQLAVLHHNKWPAILVEGGYLTSPVEAARILKPEYRQSLAQAIADGLIDYQR